MRMMAVLSALALIVPAISYADATSTTATVTYSSNPELSCPANSTLGGRKCYCIPGYSVSGSQCVKNEPVPPAQNEIYQDISAAVAFNTDLTCTQLGFFTAIDVDMCQKYKANPNGQWKLIQRPSSAPPLVTNPWAQSSQQTLSVNLASSTQSIPAIETTPPLPPPPPAPTTTPQITKASSESFVKEKPEPQAEAKPTSVAPATPPDTSTPTTTTQSTPPAATSSPDAELQNAIAAKDLVKMSSILAQLAAASEAVAPPPLPPEPTPIPHEDIKIKNDATETEQPKSVFKKILDWFFSII